MSRPVEERDGVHIPPGTGSHWGKACETTSGDHESGEENPSCNIAGTGTVPDEYWSAASALAAFPPENGWQHIYQGICYGCCYCCKLDVDNPPYALMTAPCLGISGAGSESGCVLAYDETDGCYKCYIAGTCLGRPFNVWVKICCTQVVGTGTGTGTIWKWKPQIAFSGIDVTEPPANEFFDADDGWTSDCDRSTFVINAVWTGFVADVCCTDPGDSIAITITGVPKGPEKWWCVKQSTPGNRRICTQDTTEAYDGPFDSEGDCTGNCPEPDTWCVEWQDEDEDGNPTGLPYVTCEGLGTGDELGQIISEGTRTGIVIGGPWSSENCSLACPPCGGDYSS